MRLNLVTEIVMLKIKHNNRDVSEMAVSITWHDNRTKATVELHEAIQQGLLGQHCMFDSELNFYICIFINLLLL